MLQQVRNLVSGVIGRPVGWENLRYARNPGLVQIPNRRTMMQMGANPRYATPFGNSPVQSLGRFHGTDDTLKKMVEFARGPEGEQSSMVRQWVESIVRLLRPKDYLSEILAMRSWCTGPHLRYANDARHVEQVKSPVRILTEIQQYGVSNVDCDDLGTLLGTFGLCLGRNARLTAVGFGAPGDYSHVFACLQEPRSAEWIIVDPVAGTRELEMAKAVTTYKHISLDE